VRRRDFIASQLRTCLPLLPSSQRPYGVSQPAENTGSLASRQVLRSDPLPEFGIDPAAMGIRHAKYPT
jgi:hypothetical protein